MLQVCLFCNQYTAKINECYEMHEYVFVGFIFFFKAADNPTVYEIRDVCQSQGLNCEVEVN